MAHFPKPFFRPTRGLWYVQILGKQVNLGRDKDAAFKAYHELMAKRDEAVPDATVQIANDRFVVVIIDEFLDWCQKHRAADTYQWYKERLNSFCLSIDKSLTVDRLRPHHVQKWVDGRTGLASGSLRNLIASVKRSMKWAEEQGYVDRSPLANLRKPGCGRKELVVSPEQYREMLNRTKDQNFKDLLTITWETGCRPQESLRVEARHIDLEGHRWLFPASESKGKKIPRVVYLTSVALEITERLMKKHPTGRLFRNRDGLPWTPDATNCRFQRLQVKSGIKFCLYNLRHSFATHALMRGIDCVTVATLLGHSDPSMLARTYQHLSQNPGFLKDQLRQARAIVSAG